MSGKSVTHWYDSNNHHLVSTYSDRDNGSIDCFGEDLYQFLNGFKLANIFNVGMIAPQFILNHQEYKNYVGEFYIVTESTSSDYNYYVYGMKDEFFIKVITTKEIFSGTLKEFDKYLSNLVIIT